MFIVLEADKLREKKVQRFRNFGLCVVVLDKKGRPQRYWRDLGRWGGALSEIGDPTLSEMPKLYVRVSAALKLVKRLTSELSASKIASRAALAAWFHDDVYTDDKGRSNALTEYMLHTRRFPGSPRGKGR